MTPHAKVYLAAFGYCQDDFIPSEISSTRANDIHHIDARGMGGTTKDDRIEELMAVTRQQHIKFGDKTQYMAALYGVHMRFLERHGVVFDRTYMQERIDYWNEQGGQENLYG